MLPITLTAIAVATLIILKLERKIMSALDNVNASSQALIVKADALLAFAVASAAQAAALQARLDAIGNQDPELQAVADSLRAEADKVAAFLTPPPAPAPIVDPAPSPALPAEPGTPPPPVAT